eukprot:8754404-Pyramimonas_sp.AAC.1
MDYVDNLTAKLLMLSQAPSQQPPGGSACPSQANLRVKQASLGTPWSAKGASSVSRTAVLERIPGQTRQSK